MCPRSSTPRVMSMERYMPSKSSRSRPASFTSDSEPTGSASRAIAIQIPFSLETADTLSAGFARPFGGRGLRLPDGQGVGLAARGAPEDPRRLGRRVPLVRLRAALLRRVGGRVAGRLPAVRRRTPLALPVLRRALLVGLRGRVRVLRTAAAAR